MIKEYENIMTDISLLITDISESYKEGVDFTVKYLDHEVSHHVLEIFILNKRLPNKNHEQFLREIKKFDIVMGIYTLEYAKLYTVLLKPIEEIRNKKINKLQKKITNEAYNKV